MLTGLAPGRPVPMKHILKWANGWPMLDTGNSNPIKIKTMKKNKKRFIVTGVIGAAILLLTCGLMIVNHKSSHQQMIDVLKDLAKRNNDVRSAFNPEVKYALLDSIIRMN